MTDCVTKKRKIKEIKRRKWKFYLEKVFIVPKFVNFILKGGDQI